MNIEPVFRLAELSDRENVLSLLNTVFGAQQRSVLNRENDFWNWKYFSSPFGESLLIVVEHHNEIIGVANLWPWELQCRGQVLRALQPCDSVVHPDFRGRGFFKKSRIYGLELARKEGYDLIFNYPNKNSLPVYKSLGWKYLGLIPWWVKILKPVSVLKGYFFESKAGPLNIDPELKVDPSLLDEIAKRSISFDGNVKINRVEGFHQWRYVNRPNRSYGMIVYQDGRKRTAAVFTLNQKGGNREMVIVDIVGAPGCIIPLFKKINRFAKQMEVDFIAVMNNSQYSTQNLWKLGYIKKGLKNMVVLPLDIGLEYKTTSLSGWSLMAGMHDSI